MIWVCNSECLSCWVLLKQFRSDHVDALIGGLRREDRGRQQLESISVVKLTFSIWVLKSESLMNEPSTALWGSRLAKGSHGSTLASVLHAA